MEDKNSNILSKHICELNMKVKTPVIKWYVKERKTEADISIYM